MKNYVVLLFKLQNYTDKVYKKNYEKAIKIIFSIYDKGYLVLIFR